MFLIFGFGHRKFKREGTVKGNCTRCNNTVDKELVKATSSFTLFFIPVIPYSTKYLLVCPICSESYELSKEEFYRMAQGADIPPFVPAQDFTGKTPTQINYLKQMEEYERGKEQTSE